MRRARANAGAEWGRRWDAWLLAEDRRLAQLAPLLEVPQLAAELASEFGIPRTPQAVRHRAATLGVRVPIRWMSLADIERLFGIDGGTVLRRWVASGALRALPRSGRGRAPHWRFRETDVEAFIRAHPWLYDWKRMQMASRFRSLAEVIHKVDPWLILAEAELQSSLSIKQLRRLIAQDVLPHERRWHGCGPWGQIVVRAADLDLIGQASANGGR
jgi:hypothetical protein